MALTPIDLSKLPQRRPVPINPAPGIGSALASTLAAIGAGAAGFAGGAIQLRQADQRYKLDRAMLDAQSKVQLATLDVAARQGDLDAVRELSYWNSGGATRAGARAGDLFGYYVQEQAGSPLASPTALALVVGAIVVAALVLTRK